MDPNYAIWEILFQKILHTSRKKNKSWSSFFKRGLHWEFCGIFENNLVLEHLWATVCEKCTGATECEASVNSVSLQRLPFFKIDCSKINYPRRHSAQKKKIG